ncbi:ribulose phosphate epimerase [Hahella sp. CCB-MM4]|uniref:GFA family protein n=1 Tax=Hahella sp. (strain CCB-MM4) TaxID=1926491 RepID=UPI000B9BDF1F|nr:ribulose phosphate epimerase [Hahella sp. CCB-MM4]
MYQGSCLCGSVSYELKSPPKAVTNCHCNMCQKQHGTAFATYGSVPLKDLVYLKGREMLVAYESSSGITRKFCGTCGSSVEWSGNSKFPDWVSIAIGTLDTPLTVNRIKDVHPDTKVCWLHSESTS